MSWEAMCARQELAQVQGHHLHVWAQLLGLGGAAINRTGGHGVLVADGCKLVVQPSGLCGHMLPWPCEAVSLTWHAANQAKFCMFNVQLHSCMQS